MQRKTVTKIIKKKLEEWLESITDVQLRKDVRENIVVLGGSITSLLQNLPVNDYDIFIKDMDVLLRLAKYYVPKYVLDGRLRDDYLFKHYTEKYNSELEARARMKDYLQTDKSEMTVRLKNLKPDQIKLNIPSAGYSPEREENDERKYLPVFLSQNAISLTDDIQIVLRFHGDSSEVVKTFDFIHATNYFTYEEGLVTNIKALESILTKQLSYQGSLYPLTSIIRIKKFLQRGWSINAGEMLKIMFQVSELDLKDPEVLEEQLIGVDIAYFADLITALRGEDSGSITSESINRLIDKVFNESEIEEDV